MTTCKPQTMNPIEDIQDRGEQHTVARFDIYVNLPHDFKGMVRDVAARLETEPRIGAYCVESENFESIHNHSAYALIERTKPQPA